MSQDAYLRARNAVNELYIRAGESRTMWAGFKQKQRLIQATHQASWDLLDAMDSVLEYWDEIVDKRTVVTPILTALKHIDGTPAAAEDMPTPEVISLITATAVAKIKTLLPKTEHVSQLENVGKDMAKLMTESALEAQPGNTQTVVEPEPPPLPDIPQPDPEDKMD